MYLLVSSALLATTRAALLLSETWRASVRAHNEGRMRRATAVSSPVFADQVLLVKVEHWQSRGRELVEVFHGACAGGAGGAGDALGLSRGQSS